MGPMILKDTPPNQSHARHQGGQRTREAVPPAPQDAPLVTVVTAVYNGAQFLRACIESVRLQEYPAVEHIIIDAGSNDGTLDILAEYDDQLALWISEPDRGIYDAWNKGVALARGQWIAFLGADDEYQPGAISAYMQLARQHPAAEYLSSQMRLVQPEGYSRLHGDPWEWPRYNRYMCSAHVGSMHRRDMFERYGLFDLSYKITADYEFLLRPRHTLNAAYMPLVTIQMRGGGMSESIAALHEASRAKITTGGRNKWIGKAELAIALAKFKTKKLLVSLLHKTNLLSSISH